MAVTDTGTTAGPYIGNGSTTTFPYTFDVLAGDELDVIIDGVELASGYFSVDLVNKNVTLTGPLVNGAVLYITSNPSFQQQVQFENGSRWLADPVNEANDRSAIRDIYLLGRVKRAPQAPLVPEEAAGLFPTINGDGEWVFTPAGPGATGSSDNTYSSLTAFKASDTTRLTASLVGVQDVPDGRFNWTPGNFSGRADDANFIKANGTPLSVGAWVRDLSSFVAPASSALIAAVPATGGTSIRLNTGAFTGGTIPNRKLVIEGRGMQATTISPPTSTGVAYRSTDTAPSWVYATGRQFNVLGTGTRQGTGVRVGPDSYSAGAEYAGRQVVDGVRFENLTTAIDRPFGNIGLICYNPVFEIADYHLRAASNPGTANGGVGDVMHAGCSFMAFGHAQGAQIAHDYVDGKSVIGTCQIIRYGNIIESNPGHVRYYRDVSHQGGFPAIKIADEYSEANCTAVSVTTPDANAVAPAWYYAINCNLAIVDNSAPGRVVLQDAAMLTISSDLTNLTVAMNEDSTLVHRDARRFTGKAPGLTMSIGEVQNADALNGPSYEMPAPIAAAPKRSNVLIASSMQVPETWVGSATVTTTEITDGSGLPFMQKLQQLSISVGQTLFPNTTFAIDASKYIVFKYVARLASGPPVTVQINGSAGVGGSLVIDNAVMRMQVGVFRTTSAVTAVSLYHVAGASGSVLQIAGYAVSVFDDAQSALAFANQPIIPIELRPLYTVTISSPARALAAGTALPASGASYVQADDQAVRDRLAVLERVVGTLIQDEQKGLLPR